MKSDFLEYYCNLLPQFQNTSLLEKYLTIQNPPVLLFSKTHHVEIKKIWQEEGLNWQVLEWYPYAALWPKNKELGTPLPGYEQGWIYALNAASLLPVVALSPQTGDAILDAAAAPGGKTLAIANLVDLSKTLLFANDISPHRSSSMRRVFEKFDIGKIEVWNRQIQTLARNSPATFNKILLDAPCSSEKHIFNSPKHLAEWSPNRSNTLAKTQIALIESLLPILSPGGTLVYSTCALSPLENEQVVESITKKHPELSLSRMERINAFDEPLDPMFVATLLKS